MEFTLRPWHIDDVESLVEHANNKNIAKFMTDGFPNPYTVEKGLAFIEMALSFTPNRFYAIVVDGKAVGGIGVHPQADIQKHNAELGYWLSEKYWGNGIMTKAISQMIEIGFRDFDINRIYARPFGTNLASQRILEKVGFTFEHRFEKTFVKNGELIDELYYSMRR